MSQKMRRREMKKGNAGSGGGTAGVGEVNAGSAAERKGFTNQWVFAKVMHDNRDICRDVASAVLGRRVERVEMLDAESAEPTVTTRGVRFDVYFQGDGDAVAMEMRAYEDESWVSDMRLYEYDQIEERNRACAKARAEGRAEGEKQQAALLARMAELGRDAGEFLDAVANGTLGDLYRKYGIE